MLHVDMNLPVSKDILLPLSEPLLESDSVLSSSSSSTSVASDHLDYISSFHVSASNLSRHSDSVFESFNEALSQNSSITMLPNYDISPTGEESGDFLVIDLGGSTLRVAVVSIDPRSANKATVVIEKKWLVENSFKLVDLNFFKWISAKIVETLGEQSVLSTKSVLKTGITWSFPLDQTSFNKGRIQVMAKGYTVSPDVYNKDLKDLLESTMKESYDIDVDVRALVNDSLAVYAAGAYLDKYMKLAIVLGTGLNMCCSLKTSDKFHEHKTLNQEPAVLLNSELSLFGHQLIPDICTKYDKLIDSRLDATVSDLGFIPYMELPESKRKILQPSELTTSGRYLPEITRLILVDMIKNHEILNNIPKKSIQHLYNAYDGFSGEVMCFISENNDEVLIKEKLQSVYGWDSECVLYEDIYKIRTAIQAVITRGAYIVASMIIASIKLISHHNGQINQGPGPQKLHIGFVGSVLEYFNEYRELILKFIRENEDIQKMDIFVDFKFVAHSSIVGAAVGAAYYSSSS